MKIHQIFRMQERPSLSVLRSKKLLGHPENLFDFRYAQKGVTLLVPETESVSVHKWMVGLVSLLIIILDQFTKWLAREIIIEPITLTSFLSFTTIHNTGIAFGLFQGYGWIFTSVAIVIIVGLIYYYPKISEAWFPQLSYAFIMSGAIGNLMDRIVFGRVTDFISFSFWPAFNVADMSITMGVIGLMAYYLKK